MQTQIVSIGNSFGLRLPRPVLDALQLEKSSPVTIELRKGSIVLRPAPKAKPAAPRAGWFDAAVLENAARATVAPEEQDWQALDAALLNDATLDEEWQW